MRQKKDNIDLFGDWCGSGRGMRSGILGAAVVAALCSGAEAQTDPRNAGLPRASTIETLRPVPGMVTGTSFGVINNIQITTGFTFGESRRKNSPTIHRDQARSPNIGISFGIGTMGFAAVSATYSRHESRSNIAAFALPVNSEAESSGFDAVVGVAPLPFLRAGVIVGAGKGSSAYAFTGIPAPPIDSNSDTRRFGGFVGASYLLGGVLLSADATVISVRNHMRFAPNNIPPSSRWGSDIAMLGLNAAYSVTDNLQLSAGIVLNRVLSQKVAGTEPKLDPSWLTLQVGAKYRITSNWEINATARTWVANSRYDHRSATIGAAYRF